MSPLPTNPTAFQSRVMEALLADIGERKGFPRLDAIRHISREREAGQQSPEQSR
jgi:hypothetical protein